MREKNAGLKVKRGEIHGKTTKNTKSMHKSNFCLQKKNKSNRKKKENACKSKKEKTKKKKSKKEKEEINFFLFFNLF